MDGREPHSPARAALVGRDDELRRFGELLDLGRRGVMLVGPPGVGKTRLAEALCAAGSGRGLATRFVSARGSTTDIPLAPFASLLSADLSHTEGVSLLVEARHAVERLAGGKPLLLGIDDAQLFDATSATLVHQLVASNVVTAVVTVRADEWVPPPILELTRTGLLERWEVDGLSMGTSVKLARELLGPDPDLGRAEEIARLSSGNPLFITALAHAAREHDRSVPLAAAPSLVDFVAAELQSLSPSRRDALAVVALAEPIGIEILEALVEPSALIELEREVWITVMEDERRVDVRLRHPLFGEVLRRSMSRMLARSIYGDLADLVRTRGARRRSDRLRVAFWSLESGHSLPAEEMAGAARQALDAGDPDLAARFAEAVWDGGDGEHRFAAGMLLLSARSSRVLADPDGFSAALSQAARTPVEHATLAMATAYDHAMRRADVIGAIGALQWRIAAIDDPVLRTLLEGYGSTLYALTGDLSPAAVGREQLLATEHPIAPDLVMLLDEVVATSTGRPSAAMDELIATVTADPTARATPPMDRLPRQASLSAVSRWLIQRGKGHEAEAWARAAVADRDAVQQLGARPLSDLAWVLMWRGDVHQSRAMARAAAERQRRLGLRLLERWSRLIEAMAAASAGDAAGARWALAEADRLGPDPTTHRNGDELYSRSLLAETDGDIDLAISLSHDQIADAVRRGSVWDEALGWMSVAWLQPPTDESVRRLRELADEAGGIADVFAPYAEARMVDDAVGIAAAAELAATAGMRGFAATFMRQASEVAAGRDDRLAARLSRRAAELYSDLTLGGAFEFGSPVEPLTRREREIADLAANGRASREIGESLFLSTRTVDNHLARIYDKLGVDSREELSAALAGSQATG